jgi:glutamate dehydrogenase
MEAMTDAAPTFAAGDVAGADAVPGATGHLDDENDLATKLLDPDGPSRIASWTSPGHGDGRLRCLLVGLDEPRLLSELVPTFAGFGLAVAEQRRRQVLSPEGEPCWADTFDLVSRSPVPGGGLDGFDEALAAVLNGWAEADGFNALVLRAGLSWRHVAALRAYGRYLRQAGVRFSQAYIEQALVENPDVVRALVGLFDVRFDPDRFTSAADERNAAAAACEDRLHRALQAVQSLDHDRILRSQAELIRATLRTSFFQRQPFGPAEQYLAFKLDPGALTGLPAPRPRFEVWVYSPRFEGVHLRFGAVARGGLRWSDRREDFRTEVLGLAKAQAVKNAVIVPAGAKGGFVCKRFCDPADREAWLAEGRACYRLFICALLDLTDNLNGGLVLPPADVVRYDGDDPYLVVAADKGTATFSDIANEVAVGRGFWLGDGFASGGRTGYDHKALGITARGAWESVTRHFRELGRDPGTEDVTVVGIGDMSGDVFGNGMLLSAHIRLVAAFDHRHVFLDPDPDPATSYTERRRLFDLPRSSWADYDPALISRGGGVHPRAAKAIAVSDAVRRRLGLDTAAETLTPDELIRGILRAPVDLLWNGGIGTYVKARAEGHAAVGDKANDAVRVDGAELRCQIVGEGGNLGLTQLARVEYAGRGGRVNTDAIDNSAGVDTSDHEVNLKILLDPAVRSGDLSIAARNELLAEVQDEVADLVLIDNYGQNLQLGAAESGAAESLDRHAALIGFLEREGYLQRAQEFLPDEVELAARRAAGRGLARPELCVLLAHSKRSLRDDLENSDVPDDPYLHEELAGYFPAPVRERFRDRLAAHPLRREIVTTCLINDLVDHVGAGFVHRLEERTGASTADAVRAYVICRNVFGLPALWASLRRTGTQFPPDAERLVLESTAGLLEHSAAWLLRNRRLALDLAVEVDAFRQPVTRLARSLPEVLDEASRTVLDERTGRLVSAGVAPDTAAGAALLGPLAAAFDLVEIARLAGREPLEAATVYYAIGRRLKLDDVRARIYAARVDSHWTSIAQAGLLDDLVAQQRRLATAALRRMPPGVAVVDAVDRWTGQHPALPRWEELLREPRRVPGVRLAPAVVAVQTLRDLATSAAAAG